MYKNIQIETLKIFANKFASEILGQEKAKTKLLVNLYQLAKNYNKGKPIVLMLFGPAGVGKTETAKLLSSVLGQHLFRKQFSMFHTNSFADYILVQATTHLPFQETFWKEKAMLFCLMSLINPTMCFTVHFIRCSMKANMKIRITK